MFLSILLSLAGDIPGLSHKYEGRRMVTAISRKARLSLMLLGSLCALTLGLVSAPAPANAAVSYYCTGWLNGGASCWGAQRLHYQTYGWGDQGAVCVAVGGWGGRCSSGPGVGVYSDRAAFSMNVNPFIANSSAKANFVHGVAFQP